MKLWVISSVHLGVRRVLSTFLLSPHAPVSLMGHLLGRVHWGVGTNSGGGLGRSWHVGWPKLSTLCLRNNNLSRFSALRRYLYLPANLATLNSLSDAQLDEGIARYFRARLANFGSSFSWLCHHCRGSDSGSEQGSFTYFSISSSSSSTIVFLLQEMLRSMDSVLPPPVLTRPPGR